MAAELKEILSRNVLFRHLSDQEIDALCAQASTKNYSANELIVKEGDIGDLLYIITSGTARVFTHNINNDEINLTKLQVGDYFGEQALMTQTPSRRNASIQAITGVTALTLNHAMLQHCLEINKGLYSLLAEHGERQLITKLSKQLHDRSTKVKELFSLFQGIENFAEKQIIFTQGDEPDNAFLLLNGSVEIRIFDEEKHITLTSIILPGQIFGEQAVIKKTQRAGTAVALNDSKIMVINAEALRQAYAKNINLSTLLGNLMQSYELPIKGIMTRYKGSFLGKPAVETNIIKPNGEIIIVSHITSANIFAIRYVTEDQNVITHSFKESAERSREIMLLNNKLIGIISIGDWNDSVDVYRLVDLKPEITPETLQQFQESGKLNIKN